MIVLVIGSHSIIISLTWNMISTIADPSVVVIYSVIKAIYFNLYTRKWLIRHLTIQHWHFEKCLFHLTGIITLIVISFGVDYWSLHQTIPEAFVGIYDHQSTKLQFFNFLYFSAVSFSTVGFGDIAPIAAAAKLMVLTEIVTSFFVIIFVFTNFYNLKSDKNSENKLEL